MKIISWNVNGLRSVYKKGFLSWFKEENADIVCLQEIKSDMGKVPAELLKIKNYYSYFNPAQKKGYSGTAVYTKQKPLKVENKLGFKAFDEEGRFLKLTFPKFSLINIYLPHGGRGKEKLGYKIEVYNFLIDCLKKQKENIILIGDFNIAHEEIDLARPKSNKKNIMFTPEERGQIDRLMGLGFADSFRKFNEKGGNYTWWVYMANARQRNLGWRIDYAFVSKKMIPKIKRGFILSKVPGSDHCPVGIIL